MMPDALMSWFDRITGRRKNAAGGNEDVVPSTPSERWTIAGIRFDTSGWRLTDASPSTMSWSAPDGSLVLTSEASPGDQMPGSLSDLRNQHRARARADGGDIVQVEVVRLACGDALQAIYKKRSGLGHCYRGVTTVRSGPTRFRMESTIDEGGTTGLREATISAMLASCGEFAVGEKNADGSFAIKGWTFDPYDPAFDADALNGIVDDWRLDEFMPQHPLSRTRASLRAIAASLTLDGGEAPAVADAEASRGPRRQLSGNVFRACAAAFKRDDLFEQSLREEIDSLGDTASFQLGLCLLQMGMIHTSNGRPGNALPILTRAESMIEATSGGNAHQLAVVRTHRAHAVLKLGRRKDALSLFLQAIELFERSPNAETDVSYVLALGQVPALLSEQGDTERAMEYLRRVQPLVEKAQRSDRAH